MSEIMNRVTSLDTNRAYPLPEQSRISMIRTYDRHSPKRSLVLSVKNRPLLNFVCSVVRIYFNVLRSKLISKVHTLCSIQHPTAHAGSFTNHPLPIVGSSKRHGFPSK